MNKKQIKKSQNFLSTLISIFIISLITFSITNYLKKINYFKVKKIIIEGNDFVKDRDIKNITNIFLTDQNILSLDLDSLKQSINKNEYIQSNKVYTYLPSTLCIKINEISPLGLYEMNNKIFLLDNRSNVIEASIDAINFYDIPIISNEKNKIIDLAQISNILNNIQNYNSNLFLMINEIQLKNEKINIVLNNKTTIKLRDRDIDKNLNILFSFINTIQSKKNISSYKYIDLTIRDQVIVKDKKIKI
jgi:cell division septal protein FtsQ